MLRILRGNDKKRFAQLISHAVNRDAVFLHCFQQRALRFRSRPVYLVDQHYLRKKRSAVKHEALLIVVENGIAENIGRTSPKLELSCLLIEN